MSAVGKSVSDKTPVRAAQPVCLIDMETGLPVVGGGGGGGSSDGLTDAELRASPLTVVQHQGNIISGPLALTADAAATIIGAFAERRGMMVANYIAAPVYMALGTTGTPASGAGAICIPPAVDDVPGVFVFPFAPVGGVRAVCASAGSLTVTVW